MKTYKLSEQQREAIRKDLIATSPLSGDKGLHSFLLCLEGIINQGLIVDCDHIGNSKFITDGNRLFPIVLCKDCGEERAWKPMEIRENG